MLEQQAKLWEQQVKILERLEEKRNKQAAATGELVDYNSLFAG